MEEQDYVMSHYVYHSLMALQDFATYAFCGYGEGRGYKEEKEVADSFSLLVRDFINLIDASKETVEEYIDNRPYLQRMLKQKELERIQQELKKDI